MSDPSSAQYVHHRKFADFDELCDRVRQWDLDLQQMENGSFAGELLQFGHGPIHVSEARFGRSVLQQGSPPAGMRTIGVPAGPHVRFQWRGHRCTGTNLVIFPRGGELNCISNADFHIYTCSFPEDLLASMSECTGLADLDQIRDGNEVVTCSAGTMSRLRSLLRCVSVSQRPDCATTSHSQIEHVLTHELPRQLLCAIAEVNGVPLGNSTSRREVALNRAVRFIQRWAHEGVTIRQVCASTGVSQRTLEYAFNEGYGLTPKAFLSAYRLGMVRKLLRVAEPKRFSVADAANRWGFWHMGQFAADYRELFGELPSKTLRNSYETNNVGLIRGR